ncbi:MAG: hypothetical protein JKY89_13610 [Immundisolibacteraceae bacterium]|nr:hypothetical protein [Immundisolibacteraceae bacterium]
MDEKLLKLLGISHVLGGLLLSCLLFIEPIHPLVLQLIYGTSAVPNQPQIFFWLSILGPSIASWGVLFCLAVRQYFAHPSGDTLRMMVASILVWAPLDSALCLYNGIVIGAIGNALVVLVFLVLFYRVRGLAGQA